jgi:hypothetical protein
MNVLAASGSAETPASRSENAPRIKGKRRLFMGESDMDKELWSAVRMA